MLVERLLQIQGDKLVEAVGCDWNPKVVCSSVRSIKSPSFHLWYLFRLYARRSTFPSLLSLPLHLAYHRAIAVALGSGNSYQLASKLVSSLLPSWNKQQLSCTAPVTSETIDSTCSDSVIGCAESPWATYTWELPARLDWQSPLVPRLNQLTLVYSPFSSISK